MQESIKIEDILKALKGKIYYSKEKKGTEKKLGLEEIYKTTIVIAVKDLTEEKINSLSSSSFLRVNYLQNIKTDNLDMNEYHERLIKRLN